MRSYYVYVMASRSRNLYVGATNNLARRVVQHKTGTGSAFAAKYRINRLVYVEEIGDVLTAIAREKEIKGWRRSKKIVLIETLNPTWTDLAVGWGTSDPSLRSG